MSKEEKLQSFKKHDFDGDEKWVAYIKNVEVPSGDIAAAKLKLRAKWYKKNVDSDFEVEWVTSSSSSYTPPPASRASYTPPPQQTAPPPQQQQPSSGSSSGPRASPQQQPGDSSSGTQRRLFFLHTALILTGVFSAIPFVPYARFLYTTFLKLAVLCHGFKLYLKTGLPVLRPFAWANIMAWAAKVVPSTDMFHFLCSLIFMSHPPALMLTVPILVLAGYHAMAYASQHFAGTMLWRRYGAKYHGMMMERQHDAMQLNALSEVSLGLVLIVQLLTPQRNLLLLFFYWNMLKARYHAPSDTCWQHQQVWRNLDAYTSQWRQRLPILNTPINLVKRWFLAVPQPRA